MSAIAVSTPGTLLQPGLLPRQPTPGDLYADYEEVVRRIEASVLALSPSFPGCRAEHVRARLVQRVVELSSDAYIAQAADRARSGTASQAPAVVTVGGLRIDTRTGRVSIPARTACKSVLRFGVVWAKYAARLASAVLRGRSPAESVAATLLFDPPALHSDGDGRFVEFCRGGAIEPLRAASRFVVAAAAPPAAATDAAFSYAPLPLLALVETLLSRRDRIAALAAHAIAPLRWLRAIAACRLNMLLDYDAALLPLVRSLDRRRVLEAMVVTTSSFVSQPLWMIGAEGQGFKLHTLWYSQNFIPKMYLGDTRRPDLPNARHIRSDVHWVWTEGFRDYLASLGQRCPIHVVGPILWYLPAAVAVEDAPLNVALFDVTPLPDGHTAFGAAKNYYSVRTISQFVIDVLDLCTQISAETGRDIRVLLKHKRPPRVGRHDSTYIDFLDRLAAANERFRLIDHQTNLFGLLERCDTSVSVPYTSTAYVAASLGKPALYYDPFAELVDAHEENEFVSFASGRDELAMLLRRLLGAAAVPA